MKEVFVIVKARYDDYEVISVTHSEDRAKDLCKEYNELPKPEHRDKWGYYYETIPFIE